MQRLPRQSNRATRTEQGTRRPAHDVRALDTVPSTQCVVRSTQPLRTEWPVLRTTYEARRTTTGGLVLSAWLR